jgi:hypothetical protein
MPDYIGAPGSLHPRNLILEVPLRGRVILEKLMVTELIKKFPALYEIRKFILYLQQSVNGPHSKTNPVIP